MERIAARPTTSTTADLPPAGRVSSRRRAVAFASIAFALGVTMTGTTLPTPLYALYQRQMHFESLLTTVIYAVYAGGVLVALLAFGRASDQIGRRRVLLAGLVASALSALVFVTDAGLPVLFTGRVLSGLSAGVFTGTATAALLDLVQPTGRRRVREHRSEERVRSGAVPESARYQDRARATLLSTVVNMVGLGCGPLLAGLLAEVAPAPLRLPFLVHLALLAVAAVGVLAAPETVRVRPGARPRPQRPVLPESVRSVFVPAAIAAFAAFAVFGLLTAVEPGFLVLLGHTDKLLAGAVVFAMFIGSAVGQVGLARLHHASALPLGCVVLVAGLGGVAAALVVASLAVLVAGTVVVGLGHGIAFRAGMTAVAERAPAEQRAGTASSFFVVAYLGISVPVVLVGVASRLVGLRTAGIAFTVMVAVLTLVALALLLLRRRSAVAREPA